MKRKRSRIRLQLVYAKTGAEDQPLCGGGFAFLVTCLRTAVHGETELLTVLKIPFRVRTPPRGYWCRPVYELIENDSRTGTRLKTPLAWGWLCTAACGINANDTRKFK